MNRPTRRFPWILLAANVVALLGIWFGLDVMRHLKILLTDLLLLLSVLATVVWVFFFSGFSRRVRWSVLTLFVLLIAFLVSFVRVRGMTGDWVPILDWSWNPLPDAVLADAPETQGAIPASLADGPSYPQFSGAARDSRVPGVFLQRDFATHPPKLLWRRSIGAGWSGFAVAAGIAVTQEQRGPEELVAAYALDTGEPIWTHADKARFDDNSWLGGIGPRATPTIDVENGAVFSMGATGIVNRLDLLDGKSRWSKNLIEDFGGKYPGYAYAGSPLLVDDLVVLAAGADAGTLVALDRETGELVWSAGDDDASYSSPMLAVLDEQRQIVLLSERKIGGYDPNSGAVLWTHAWESSGFPTAMQPVPLAGNRLLASAAYGIGSKLYEVSADGDSWTSKILWETPRLKAKFSQLIEIDGLVYGLDDGVMACFDPESGERLWKRGRYGHGHTLLVGDLLLVAGEKGEVILVEPDPEGLNELSRFSAIDGKVWNPHAVAGSYLLVRNDQEATAWRLPLRDP